MNATTTDVVAYGAARRALFAASPAELLPTLIATAERVPAMVEQLRISEPGGADRAENLASQVEGVRVLALRLGAALRDIASVHRDGG